MVISAERVRFLPSIFRVPAKAGHFRRLGYRISKEIKDEHETELKFAHETVNKLIEEHRQLEKEQENIDWLRTSIANDIPITFQKERLVNDLVNYAARITDNKGMISYEIERLRLMIETEIKAVDNAVNFEIFAEKINNDLYRRSKNFEATMKEFEIIKKRAVSNIKKLNDLINESGTENLKLKYRSALASYIKKERANFDAFKSRVEPELKRIRETIEKNTLQLFREIKKGLENLKTQLFAQRRNLDSANVNFRAFLIARVDKAKGAAPDRLRRVENEFNLSLANIKDSIKIEKEILRNTQKKSSLQAQNMINIEKHINAAANVAAGIQKSEKAETHAIITSILTSIERDYLIKR